MAAGGRKLSASSDPSERHGPQRTTPVETAAEVIKYGSLALPPRLDNKGTRTLSAIPAPSRGQ